LIQKDFAWLFCQCKLEAIGKFGQWYICTGFDETIEREQSGSDLRLMDI
jgi:hypothetical protein